MKKSVKLTCYQQKIVEENIGFAMNMGKHYGSLAAARGVSVEDLQQEACWALCTAAQKYDPKRDVSFVTFAYNYCRKNIQNFISASRISENATCNFELCGGIIDNPENKESTYHIVEKLLSFIVFFGMFSRLKARFQIVSVDIVFNIRDHSRQL